MSVQFFSTMFGRLHKIYNDDNSIQYAVETNTGLQLAKEIYFIPVEEVLGQDEPKFVFNLLDKLIQPNSYKQDKHYLSNKDGNLYFVERSNYAEYDPEVIQLPTLTFDEWNDFTEEIGYYTAKEKKNFYCIVLWGNNEEYDYTLKKTKTMLWDYHQRTNYSFEIIPVSSQTPQIPILSKPQEKTRRQ